MQPEIIIVVLAVFIMGGTMGAAGTVLCQWILGKMSAPASRRIGAGDPRELEGLKEELADMAVRLHSVDQRLDFTEQLLGGALSGPRPLGPPSLFRRSIGLVPRMGRTGRPSRPGHLQAEK